MKKLITMAAIATLLGACGFENSRNTNANNGNLRVEANTAFHLKMIGKDLLNEESGASAAEGNLHVVSLSEVPAGVYNADLTPDDPAAFIAMSREITVKFGDTTLAITFLAATSGNQALLDAIAALQAAINSADPNSISSALAALQAAIAGVNGAVGSLQADIDALQAQAMRMLYPGLVHWDVLSNAGSAIANAVCTETNVDWASLPAGENSPRTCTTNASGECTVANLYLDRALRFRCEAATYMTEANINITLTSAQPIQAWEVRLSAAGATGDLLWQNFTVESGASRNVTGSVYQTQADGTLKAVSAADGLTCTISQGPNSISVDVDCMLLSGLAVGCGQATASLGGKSVLSKVRVTGTGAPATCP